MEWYKKFEYEKNPFTTDSFTFPITQVNHQDLHNEIMYLTKTGSLFVIQGESGTGKTTYLRQIIEHFKGKGKVVYIDGKQCQDNLDIEKILDKKGKRGLLKTTKPKDMILLLDDIEYISKKNCEKIKYYFDQNYIRSVVFTTKDYKKLKLTESIKDRILDQVITIPHMHHYEALRIVRDRFADNFFFPDEVVIALFKFSNKNIKETLLNCHKICEFVVKQGRGEVLPKYIPFIVKTAKKKAKKVKALQPPIHEEANESRIATKQEG